MQEKRGRARRWRRATAAAIFLAVVGLLAACESYEPGQVRVVTEVDTLDSGLNSSGMGVGTKDGTAVTFHAHTLVVSTIPTPGDGWTAKASGINDAGLVTGMYSGPNGERQPFTYDSTTGDVGPVNLPSGWAPTAVGAPNQDGRVLVTATNAGTTGSILYRTGDGSSVVLDDATIQSILGSTGNPVSVKGLGSGDQVFGDDYPITPYGTLNGGGPWVVDVGAHTGQRLPYGTTTTAGGVNGVKLMAMNDAGIVVGSDVACTPTGSMCERKPYVYDTVHRERLDLPGAPAQAVDESTLQPNSVDISDSGILVVNDIYDMRWMYDLTARRTITEPHPDWPDYHSSTGRYGYGCRLRPPSRYRLASGLCIGPGTREDFVVRIP